MSSVKALDIYMEPLENPKTATLNNRREYITKVFPNKIQALSTDRLHAK